MNNDNDQSQPLVQQAPIAPQLDSNPKTPATNTAQNSGKSTEPDFLQPPSNFRSFQSSVDSTTAQAPEQTSGASQPLPQQPQVSSKPLVEPPAHSIPEVTSVSNTFQPESGPLASDFGPSYSGSPEPLSQNPQNVPKSTIETNSGQKNSSGVIKKALKILLGLVIFLIILGVIYFAVQRFGGGSTKVTLTYWGLWEDQKIMQSVISDFERQNPNIQVDYTKQDIKQYRDRLVTRVVNGTGPDIFRIHNSWTTMLSTMLLPIPSNTISKSEFQNIFYPVASSDLIKNGAIYAVPLEIDTLALYINTQAFENAGIQPPTNWNEFIDAARALTVKDQDGKIKTAGAAIGAYDNVNHSPDILSLLFLQNSVNLRDLTASKDRVDGALNFYTSFTTDQDNVWDTTLDPSMLAFAKGNLAMYFGYSWDYFAIKQFNPNLDLKVVAVPQLPNQTVNLASYWAEGISVKTKHQNEALKFIKFLTQKDTEQKLYTEEAKTREFGEPYARVDLADSLKDNPIVYPFILQAKNAQSSYFIDNTYDNSLNQQANTYLGNTVNSIIGDNSSESGIDTLIKGITQVLTKYGW